MSRLQRVLLPLATLSLVSFAEPLAEAETEDGTATSSRWPGSGALSAGLTRGSIGGLPLQGPVFAVAGGARISPDVVLLGEGELTPGKTDSGLHAWWGRVGATVEGSLWDRLGLGGGIHLDYFVLDGVPAAIPSSIQHAGVGLHGVVSVDFFHVRMDRRIAVSPFVELRPALDWYFGPVVMWTASASAGVRF